MSNHNEEEKEYMPKTQFPIDQAQDNEVIYLDVYLGNDKIKTFETQLKTVRHMSLALLR